MNARVTRKRARIATFRRVKITSAGSTYPNLLCVFRTNIAYTRAFRRCEARASVDFLNAPSDARTNASCEHAAKLDSLDPFNRSTQVRACVLRSVVGTIPFVSNVTRAYGERNQEVLRSVRAPATRDKIVAGRRSQIRTYARTHACPHGGEKVKRPGAISITHQICKLVQRRRRRERLGRDVHKRPRVAG